MKFCWAEPTRRDVLLGAGLGLGAAALRALAQEPSAGHHPARARSCIFLFMEGGPSHIDTFDPKPKLNDMHMKEFHHADRFASAMASGKRYYVRSPFRFVRAGRAGLMMNEGFAHLAGVADELCVYRGLQVDSIDHPTACFQMNTGNRFGGDPSIGAWVVYGLGSPNRNLPAFVVLPEVNFPQGGAANWSNGFLPARTQGTALRAEGSPILDLAPPEGVTPEAQRANLELLARLNEADARRRPGHAEAAARAASYELAFRMQMEVPQLLDLSGEDPATLKRYGIGDPATDSFGRRCLLARRLVERGVRFVQVYAGGWDSHDYLAQAHRARIRAVDRPMAGLISDLKRRGLLDETLVVWAGEFGRSPDNGLRGGQETIGRDHNAKAMSVVLAGGGARAGAIVGATDEIGEEAVECVRPVKDLHVTLLHLLGLDDRRLTFRHEGRFKQISQTGDGTIIRELLA
jgi:hypothetical protein